MSRSISRPPATMGGMVKRPADDHSDASTVRGSRRIIRLDLQPGDDFGPFRIERFLGQGGTSQVYLAEETSLGRRVALKILLGDSEGDGEFKTRFLREAKIAAQIFHPHVVALFSSGEHQGLLYLAFEYVGGGDLGGYVKQGKVLSIDQALRMLHECTQGLAVIEEAGLVHRDIKPHNILLDDQEHVKLGDLGLARSTIGEDQCTITGSVLGTPAFMSPEQAMGKQDLDIRADIYSLGTSFYTLLTGRLPFDGDTPYAVSYAIMSQPTPHVRSLRKEAPAELDDLIAWMMAKEREDRPADVEELLHGIEELLDKADASDRRRTPEQAGKHATWQRSPRKSSPRNALIALAGIGLVCLLAWYLPRFLLEQETTDGARPAGATPTLSDPTPDASTTPVADAAAATAGDPPAASLADDRWRVTTGTDAAGHWLLLQVGSTAQRFRRLLPTKALLGSPSEEVGHKRNEGQHRVTLSKTVWIADTECTQAFYGAISGAFPSRFKDNARPVEQVSWRDCTAWIDRFNQAIPGLRARLPSEAEWEIACRAGSDTRYAFGDEPDQLPRHANFADASTGFSYRNQDLDDGTGEETAPVASYAHNAFGLYDMHGNVWEWCQDAYELRAASGRDPVNRSGSAKVRRGGSWRDPARDQRAAVRLGSAAEHRSDDLGFRLVLESLPPDTEGQLVSADP